MFDRQYGFAIPDGGIQTVAFEKRFLAKRTPSGVPSWIGLNTMGELYDLGPLALERRSIGSLAVPGPDPYAEAKRYYDNPEWLIDVAPTKKALGWHAGDLDRHSDAVRGAPFGTTIDPSLQGVNRVGAVAISKARAAALRLGLSRLRRWSAGPNCRSATDEERCQR